MSRSPFAVKNTMRRTIAIGLLCAAITVPIGTVYAMDPQRIEELSILYQGGVNGALTLAGSAVEAKVGASRYDQRKLLSVFNLSGATVYWAFASAQANATDGYPILANTSNTWQISVDVALYVFGTGNVRVMESR